MLNGYLWIVLMGLTINPIFVYAESGILVESQQQALLDDNVTTANTVDAASDSHDVIDVGSKLSWSKSLFSLGLMLYASRKLTSLVHECGHGFTGLALGGEVSEWNLKPILFGGGNPSVTWTVTSQSQQLLLKKVLLIVAAGPIAGMCTGILVGKLSGALCQRFLANSKKDEKVIKAYSKFVETSVVWWLIFRQFLNLIPLKLQKDVTDGQHILECLEDLTPSFAPSYKNVIFCCFFGLLGYTLYRIYKAGKEFYIANKQATASDAKIA